MKIVLSRMYAGSYIVDNIGHEVINTFKTDDGSHYIYVNPYGMVDSAYEKADYVILVQGVSEHIFKVIAFAEKLEAGIPHDAFKLNATARDEKTKENQKQAISSSKIEYSRVLLSDLLVSSNKKAVYYTYKANGYHAVRKDVQLYISDDEKATSAFFHEAINIPGVNFARQSLHMFFSMTEERDGKKIDKDDKPHACKALSELIGDSKYWEEEDSCQKLSEYRAEGIIQTTILDVIKKQDKENILSNWLEYYMNIYPEFMKGFAKEILIISDFEDEYTVTREKDDLDFFIETLTKYVVIENKIKSGINGIEGEDENGFVCSQLSKYYNTVKAKADAEGRTSYFYLLLPDYSFSQDRINKYKDGEKYHIIRYSQLLCFCRNTSFEKLPYMGEFIKVVQRHSHEYEEDLSSIMKERFVEKAKRLSKSHEK